MRALVMQHVACEPPGVYEDILRERGHAILRAELDEGDPLPAPRRFDAVLAMGGPMSVNDDEDLPWLTDEKRLIADAVRSGVPFWGVCLGAQLLAASLDAKVYPGAMPEVGLTSVTLTPEAASDPVFSELPRELLTLQWHGDTFDLPDGSVLLAGSELYPNQAFRWGSNAYGVQFHLEVSVDMATDWAGVPSYEEYLTRVQGPGAFPRLVTELEGAGEGLRSHGREMFTRWLDAIET
jgi:GMP synthase (glutamine-hydrolysing)